MAGQFSRYERKTIMEELLQEISDVLSNPYVQAQGDLRGMLQNAHDYLRKREFPAAFWILRAYILGWNGCESCAIAPQSAGLSNQLADKIHQIGHRLSREVNHM